MTVRLPEKPTVRRPESLFSSARGASTPCERTAAANPDVAVYLHPETRRPPARGIVRVPPDIVVEIVSPSPRDERRDRIEKMDEYASFAVPWYSILDPSLQSLEIFELIEGRYARAARATEGRLEAVPGCPGLQLDLDDLWSEISRLDGPQ